jgi:hypothetical protein
MSAALKGRWDDVPRRSLEAIGVEGYRIGACRFVTLKRISKTISAHIASSASCLVDDRRRGYWPAAARRTRKSVVAGKSQPS